MCKDHNSKLKFTHQFLKMGSYTISVEGNSSYNPNETYMLSWKTRGSKPGDEREPNNSKNRANHIKVGLPIKGYISTLGDKDYYYFSIRGTLKDPPVILLQLSGGEGINPAITLKDNWGNVVKRDNKGVYSGIRKIKTHIHPNRRYIVIIQDKTGKQKNPNKPYELRLEHTNHSKF